jgi:restriction system protein
MTLWLVRTGKYGEFEQRFLEDKRIYLSWGGFDTDLSKSGARAQLRSLIESRFPSYSKAKVSNGVGQLFGFVAGMIEGDAVIVPSKKKPAIHIGEIRGPYTFDGGGLPDLRQYRAVRWLKTDIPRSTFDPDLLYSFGAIMTVCRIERNNAEARVRAIATGATPVVDDTGGGTKTDGEGAEEVGEEDVDLERLGRDQIAKLIIQKFKGHGMERLVEAVLVAQGYTTYRSPEGADKGVDLLAAPGALGFGSPRICVQVKSTDTPVDHPTLQQLVGTMHTVQAEQGLLVSWGGFKSSVEKERAQQFFKVRLWDQDTLIAQILDNYDRLDDEIRAELPVKRVWVPALSEEE